MRHVGEQEMMIYIKKSKTEQEQEMPGKRPDAIHNRKILKSTILNTLKNYRKPCLKK